MGLGVVGWLPEPLNGIDFLDLVKREFETGCIRYSALPLKPVSKVAVMGGSGSEYLGHANSKAADAYITADIKYHQFFNPDGKILLMDIGHFESEQVAIDVLNKLLLKKLTNFAVHLSKINTNPINYY
jgi:putative NIF3 family GTP cyclohydrolase 1 type 2